ncbi:MAG: type II toxin-antitoxin system VapC family toxin [Chloroflexi bacterium]|jgi:predicted nucleic acid-binding protein|nr:type II toxin-antitoxin system VapC family toxin [Chloroflexota bacterium]
MALTVLDAGVVIAVLDGSDVHHAAATLAVAAAMDRGDDLVLPASAYAEVLVAPHRRGPEAVATVNAFLDALPASIEPATRAIAARAAELRAAHGTALRPPDTLVIATVLALGAERVVTTDARWPVVAVPVEVVGSALDQADGVGSRPGRGKHDDDRGGHDA